MNSKIQPFQDLLFKWQKSINLISSKEKNFFERHIADSLQLQKFLSAPAILIDLGSGAGLPGIPLAIESGLKLYMVESDRRKAIFLNEAIRELRLNATVINQRIEVAKLQGLENEDVIITARALAELNELLNLIQTLLENNKITRYKLLLPKGAKVLQEIEKAQKAWIFDYKLHKSETDEAASILIIESFKRKSV